ncbi:hypothetical protein TrCOL_g310 [Triparma columacea]|uniref:Uncharacterized protein n=1 Tax=Triparma columacea TaxID=722753 RepID=A0A9W7GI17_9STRA|nr:hypothetical protein TrCOL_g310 [Triparma columacea]
MSRQITSLLIRRTLPLTLPRPLPHTLPRTYSNITYSGGHASEGQGGFYGSGGARILQGSTSQRAGAVAHAGDVMELERVVGEVEKTEGLILQEGKGVSNKVIELKATLKKIVTAPAVTEIMNKLEYKGEPVWGLSESERELVAYMRQKVNEV